MLFKDAFYVPLRGKEELIFCYQLQFPEHRPLRRSVQGSVILFSKNIAPTELSSFPIVSPTTTKIPPLRGLILYSSVFDFLTTLLMN